VIIECSQMPPGAAFCDRSRDIHGMDPAPFPQLSPRKQKALHPETERRAFTVTRSTLIEPHRCLDELVHPLRVAVHASGPAAHVRSRASTQSRRNQFIEAISDPRAARFCHLCSCQLVPNNTKYIYPNDAAPMVAVFRYFRQQDLKVITSDHITATPKRKDTLSSGSLITQIPLPILEWLPRCKTPGQLGGSAQKPAGIPATRGTRRTRHRASRTAARAVIIKQVGKGTQFHPDLNESRRNAQLAFTTVESTRRLAPPHLVAGKLASQAAANEKNEEAPPRLSNHRYQ